MVDKSHYSDNIQVSEGTLDELRSLGMAASIQKAMSGNASPEFMEAVRRFYPQVVQQLDQTQMGRMHENVPQGGGPVEQAPPSMMDQVSPAPAPMGNENAAPVPGREAVERRALQGDNPQSGYTPGSGLERAPDRQENLNDMTNIAFAVQNALGMVGPEQANERNISRTGLALGANPGSPASEGGPSEVQHPMDRSLLSKLLGITSGQQTHENATGMGGANPMGPPSASKAMGPKNPEMVEALKRRMGGMAGGGRLR